MAQRLAGDIFSQRISERDDPNRSLLVDYFPEFRDFTKPIRGTINTEGPRKTGGMTGVPTFGGFKPLQHNEMMPTKLFAGSKPTGYAKAKWLILGEDDSKLMAATAYKGIPLQKAGTRFGLTATDLEELFDMREEGSSGDEFMPLVQTKMTEKGRGGVLGYKAARTPTAFKTYGALEGQGNTVATGGSIGNIKIDTPTPAAAPAPAPAKTYQGIAEGVNIYEDTVGYGVGFGPGDLRRARNEGYSDDSIRQYLTTYRGGIGEDAAGMLGIQGRAGMLQSVPAASSQPAQSAPAKTYQGIAEGVNIYEDTPGYGVGFGPGDLRRARNEGYSDESIRQYLTSYRGGIGGDAAGMLGIQGRGPL